MARARARRRSVRLWQTELFVIVIVVAILILSVSLSQGLQRTLKQLGESEQVSDASALASQIGHEFPLTVESRDGIRGHVRQFREIYGDDVWVYDIDGTVIDSVHEGGPPEEILEEARVQGLADSPPYSYMTLTPNGHVVAGKAVYDQDGRRAAVVVISGPVTDSLAVLDAVRGRLWTTFWVALIVAGLLGLGFAEFIGRRVRRMSVAAAAIADGDFDQRLPTGPVPDEIQELAESYNRMAVTLGQAFSALHEREQEITTVVESMGEGVVAFDAEGAVRVINPVAIRLFGLQESAEELIGCHVSELTDDRQIQEIVEKGLGGLDVSNTVVIGERTVLLHNTPIASDYGMDEAEDARTGRAAGSSTTGDRALDAPTDGAVLLMSDITERQKLEEAQRRFVANASHEMRTPIAAVKGLLELLTDGANDDAEVREDFLRTMSLEVDRLGRLVADLLTLAQLEAGGLRLRREPVDVQDLLQGIATIMRPLADRSSVAIEVDAPGQPVEADCDRDRITQVLVGFVDNALKHSGGGGTVTIRARAVDGQVTLEVHNEGEGIDPEVIPRLFDRFFRVDESRSGPRGTGLGLSIAKEIVEAHGSAVEVLSAPGAGATFRFRLPRAMQAEDSRTAN